VRGFLLDVTERKQTELEREAAETQYRTLVEEMPGVVYVVAADDTGSTIYVSPRIEAMLGYALEEWYSSPSFFVDSVLHADDRERVLTDLAANNEGEANACEYRCLAKDGRVVWIYDDSIPQFAPDGTVAATRGFMLDITDRKLAEEELRERDEQLRQAQRMEAVGRLAGGIAHDFNNLLTVIEGRVALLQQSTGMSAHDLEELTEVGAAAERAAALTRQLLAFSRQQVLQPIPLDLAEVVGGLSRMLRRLLVERIALTVSHQPGLWPIVADRSQVEQVLMNLVVNARDAMPAGGTITIETRNVGRAGDTDSATADLVALVVSDTGVGLDEETRAHIFEPFSTKGVGEGTGLGLATVRGIVEQKGGSVEVESEPGRGATFTVLFPRADATAVPPAGRFARAGRCDPGVDSRRRGRPRRPRARPGRARARRTHRGRGGRSCHRSRGGWRRPRLDRRAVDRRRDARSQRARALRAAPSPQAGAPGAVHVRLYGRRGDPPWPRRLRTVPQQAVPARAARRGGERAASRRGRPCRRGDGERLPRWPAALTATL
jgi:PAS domain S-box-containing protein